MNGSAKSVSIVLATHNGQAHIRELLDSLRAQTVKPLEIIVSDDDSTDNTLRIAEDFAKSSDVAVIISRNCPALGFRENFLQASKGAIGQWIAFCDQDDIWSDRKIESCSNYFDLPGVVQIGHQAELIDAKARHLGWFNQGIKSTQNRPPLYFDLWGTFHGFSQVFDARLLKVFPSENRFVDYIAPAHRIAHDRWIFFLAQILGRTVQIAEPLVKYRQHDLNLFGAGGSKHTLLRRQERGDRHAAYVDATHAMLDIVSALPAQTEQWFPEFNREAVRQRLELACRLVDARSAIYSLPKWPALLQTLKTVQAGAYSCQPGLKQWRSMAGDLVSCIMR